MRGASPQLLVLAAAGLLGACTKAAPKGELVGSYAIVGALTENTCGQAALPTPNPLQFVAEIRADSGIGRWQLTKRPAVSGSLTQSGAFSFQLDQSIAVRDALAAREDLEPADFDSLDPDFDLQRVHCTLVMRESITGTLARSMRTLQAADGSVPHDVQVGADLTGDNTITMTPSTGSDCSSALASSGGAYAALPCAAHYTLQGTLDENVTE